jgi:hypothetical protein
MARRQRIVDNNISRLHVTVSQQHGERVRHNNSLQRENQGSQLYTMSIDE